MLFFRVYCQNLNRWKQNLLERVNGKQNEYFGCERNKSWLPILQYSRWKVACVFFMQRHCSFVFEINQLVSSRLSRAQSLRCNAFSVPDTPCPRSLRGRAFSVPNTLWPWSLRGYEFFVPNTPCPHSYTADTGTGLSSSW